MLAIDFKGKNVLDSTVKLLILKGEMRHGCQPETGC
jgi:hypothetical protein